MCEFSPAHSLLVASQAMYWLMDVSKTLELEVIIVQKQISVRLSSWTIKMGKNKSLSCDGLFLCTCAFKSASNILMKYLLIPVHWMC